MSKVTLKVVGVAVVLCTFAALAATWSYSNMSGDIAACGGHDDSIALTRLSSESSEPFLFHGRPVPAARRDHDEYIQAIERFPDVRSCLADSEATTEMPNATRVAWSDIHNNQEAAVCAFRILSSIGNPGGAEQWLKSQGFTVDPRITIPASVMRRHGEGDEDPAVQIGASWDVKACGLRFADSSWLNRAAHSLGFYVIFLQSAEIDSVNVVYTFL